MNLEIEVYELVQHPAGRERLLIKNNLSLNAAIAFPFNDILHSVRTIYPDKKLKFIFTII